MFGATAAMIVAVFVICPVANQVGSVVCASGETGNSARESSMRCEERIFALFFRLLSNLACPRLLTHMNSGSRIHYGTHFHKI